jgi:hypothetical protein
MNNIVCFVSDPLCELFYVASAGFQYNKIENRFKIYNQRNKSTLTYNFSVWIKL